MLDVGTRLFAEHRYEDVSMVEIARAADVSKPMVYSYFESKQGLYLACVEQAERRLLGRLEEATPASLPPDLRVWQGLLAVFGFIDEEPDAWALLYPSGPRANGQYAAGAAGAHEAMAGLLTRMLCEAAVAEGIDEKVAREATEPLAHALAAAVHSVAAWWLRHPAEPKERQALRLMNFAWMGFDNLLRGRLWLPPPETSPAPRHARDAARDDGELESMLREDRPAALEDAFRRMTEGFDAAAAGDLDAVLEWRITGRPGGGHDRFQLHISDGECRLVPGGDAAATVTLTIRAEDFLKLMSGSARGSALFTFGKMKIDGDVVLAARVPSFFRVRRPSPGAPG